MSVFKEFREFISRGNVVDLAVGVIIGAAFNSIVKSLVDQVVMPPVGLLTSGVDFSKLEWVLRPADPVAKKAAVSIQYGAFINTVIQFLIVAFVVFLLVKGAMEIHEAIYGVAKPPPANAAMAAFVWVIVQIALIDIVFSLDSVITAVGMVRNIPVMVAAIVLAVLVMIFAADTVGEFIDGNPTIRMLALAFIMMIGVMLVGEGFSIHIPRGYIYFAMAFSAVVELLNLAAKRQKKKHLKRRQDDAGRETLS